MAQSSTFRPIFRASQEVVTFCQKPRIKTKLAFIGKHEPFSRFRAKAMQQLKQQQQRKTTEPKSPPFIIKKTNCSASSSFFQQQQLQQEKQKQIQKLILKQQQDSILEQQKVHMRTMQKDQFKLDMSFDDDLVLRELLDHQQQNINNMKQQKHQSQQHDNQNQKQNQLNSRETTAAERTEETTSIHSTTTSIAEPNRELKSPAIQQLDQQEQHQAPATTSVLAKKKEEEAEQKEPPFNSTNQHEMASSKEVEEDTESIKIQETKLKQMVSRFRGTNLTNPLIDKINQQHPDMRFVYGPDAIESNRKVAMHGGSYYLKGSCDGIDRERGVLIECKTRATLGATTRDRLQVLAYLRLFQAECDECWLVESSGRGEQRITRIGWDPVEFRTKVADKLARFCDYALSLTEQEFVSLWKDNMH